MRSQPTTLAQSLVCGWRGHAPSNSKHARLLSTTVFRSYQYRARLDIPPPFPVVKSCPDPSCNCPPTPHMPEGLPIDHDQPLNGTMAAYTQQILICTGQKDWTSRIEDDGHGHAWGSLVRGLKRLMGRGGPYLDVCGSLCFIRYLHRTTTDLELTALALQQRACDKYLRGPLYRQFRHSLCVPIPHFQIYTFDTS